MRPDDSVKDWLPGFKQGDSDAVRLAWERYFKRLVGLAHSVLHGSPHRLADEEDVALSAFKSFYFRAQQGKFPNLEDRDDVWNLLMTITVRKALRLRRREGRENQHRGPELADSDGVARDPSPELVALVKDQLQRLMNMLNDQQLQTIALSKMEGYTNEQIGEQLGRSVATVERKLQLIRRIWSRELPT
jgi:DNA-directed RNA polymerase specialized sigma24 family protein